MQYVSKQLNLGLTGEVGEHSFGVHRKSLGTPCPLVGGRLCWCLILMLLKAWDWLLQKVHGGLDHLIWSNIVHRVSGLLQREEQIPIIPVDLGNVHSL